MSVLRTLLVIVILFAGTGIEASAQPGKKGGGPPPWAPAHGYRAKTRHIFFPEFNIYFDIIKGVYIHQDGPRWITTPKVPIVLKGIDLKKKKQIELDLNVDNPHKFNSDHKVKYKVGLAKPVTKVAVKPNGKVKVAGPGLPGGIKGKVNSGGKGGKKIK